MRHDSERVKGKNYRFFNDKPLFHYIIETLSNAVLVNEVVIDTDSNVIKEYADKNFPKVRVLERPKHLRDGSIPMNNVLSNAINQIDADYYLQTHSTNPLLKPSTIDSAIDLFVSNFPVYDSLFSVTKVQTRLWDQLGRAINHNQNILLRTQDLPPVYEENSCIYIFNKEILQEKQNRIGNRPYLFEIDTKEAMDIDEEIDFKIAEFLQREH